jgi:prepilin-type N-terminal cleavage/methylation domain-containing protein
MSMSVRSRHQRGFTLIELMITAAVISVLGSVAIPSFVNMQLRSKSAERKYMVQAIYRAIDELYIRDAKFPTDLGGGTTYLNLQNEQPTGATGTMKLPWRTTAIDSSDQWNSLALSVEGAVYYRYSGWAYTLPGGHYYYIRARGDLDGDLQDNTWEKWWYWTGTTREIWAGSNLDCGDCTMAVETNAWTW